MEKPDDSTVQRWLSALDGGSALRFDDGKGTQLVHSREELDAYLKAQGVKIKLPEPAAPVVEDAPEGGEGA